MRQELILVVLDQSQPREENAALSRLRQAGPTVAVLNSGTCPVSWSGPSQLDLAASVPVCAKTGAGLDDLAELVAQTFPEIPAPAMGNCSPTSARRRPPAVRWRPSAGLGRPWTWGSPPMPCSPMWRRPWPPWGSSPAESVRDDVTDRIFQRFCVGK